MQYFDIYCGNFTETGKENKNGSKNPQKTQNLLFTFHSCLTTKRMCLDNTEKTTHLWFEIKKKILL